MTYGKGDDVMRAHDILREKANLNTWVNVAGFMILIFGGGQYVGKFERQQAANIAALEAHDERIEAIEMASRQLDNHELRLQTLESRFTDFLAGNRQLEKDVAAMQSDIRVIRQIVEGSGVPR